MKAVCTQTTVINHSPNPSCNSLYCTPNTQNCLTFHTLSNSLLRSVVFRKHLKSLKLLACVWRRCIIRSFRSYLRWYVGEVQQFSSAQKRVSQRLHFIVVLTLSGNILTVCTVYTNKCSCYRFTCCTCIHNTTTLLIVENCNYWQVKFKLNTPKHDIQW